MNDYLIKLMDRIPLWAWGLAFFALAILAGVGTALLVRHLFGAPGAWYWWALGGSLLGLAALVVALLVDLASGPNIIA